jgi:hypothetical protein
MFFQIKANLNSPQVRRAAAAMKGAYLEAQHWRHGMDFKRPFWGRERLELIYKKGR